MNIDALIGAYVQLRDKKDALKKRHSEELRPIDEMMAKLEGTLQQAMAEQNVKSFKSDHGTAYTSELVSAKVVDFNDTLSYIQENDRYDLLERRVNKTVVQEIGDVPGVELTRTLKVNVRRK